jgi:hypothetical protein
LPCCFGLFTCRELCDLIQRVSCTIRGNNSSVSQLIADGKMI